MRQKGASLPSGRRATKDAQLVVGAEGNMVGMTGSSADPAFDHKFREFLMQPDTQEVIAADQKKELDVMKKIDEKKSKHRLRHASL